jgi:hypothetical protein
MKALVTTLISLTFVAASARAQQIADSAFHFAGPQAAYAAGTGPRVCIDGGHRDFHTMDGRYFAFATLLRDDGYRVRGHDGLFSAESLGECDILVIANAAGEANAEEWSFPHVSAFTKDEISAVLAWIRSGGSLLLIADHSPWPGTNGDLGVLLGAQMLDGYVQMKIFGAIADEAIRQNAALWGVPPEEFRQRLGEPGTLGEHPILKGRNQEESVKTVTTFTGHAFYPAEDMKPLLILSADAKGGAVLNWNLPDIAQEEMPIFPVGGWLQGGATRFGTGRAVVLGEAAMCTAQLAGPERAPMGMNHPLAPENAQFCLNVVHWLSGLLDD